MKVRTDFVTNSSTTSFVIITAEGFHRDEFFKLMGVSEKSPLLPLFETLFYTFKKNMYPLDEYDDGNYVAEELSEKLKRDFSDEVINRLVKARESNHEVFIGKLSSDDNPVETFFCVDSFEVENEKIYLNALECAW